MRNRWTCDEPGYHFGRELFLAVDDARRPAWAAEVLRQCQRAVEEMPEIQDVLAVAADASRWKEGHAVFDATRRRVLILDRTPSADVALIAVLAVAETTAKITYNESREPAPFDYDAGWMLAPRARRVAELVADVETEERIWHALSRPLREVASRG